MHLFITTLLILASHAVAFASLPSQSLPVAPSAPQAPLAPGQLECARVCARIKSKLDANKSLIQNEYRQWQERLGVKKDQDVVTYDRSEQDMSAAEGLLEFMVRHFRPSQERGPRSQMNPQFLTYMMLKCFPEAYQDQTHARMSKIVDTLWTAQHVNIEKDISSCQ